MSSAPIDPIRRPVALAWAWGLAFAAGPLLAQSPVTTYEYDANGNRSKVAAPLNRNTLLGYDALKCRAQVWSACFAGCGSSSCPTK